MLQLVSTAARDPERTFEAGIDPINRAPSRSNEGVSAASGAFYRGEKVIRQHQTVLRRSRSN
jgi:hypothetical protein